MTWIMVVLVMYSCVIKIEFPTTSLDSSLRSINLFWNLLMLNGSITFLVHFLNIFLAKLIQLGHVFLHLYRFKHFILLGHKLLLKFLSFLHLHEFADFALLNNKQVLIVLVILMMAIVCHYRLFFILFIRASTLCFIILMSLTAYWGGI